MEESVTGCSGNDTTLRRGLVTSFLSIPLYTVYHLKASSYIAKIIVYGSSINDSIV